MSKSGLDTEHAEIRTHHTREDAIIYCREGQGRDGKNYTEKCIADDMRDNKRDKIYRANCIMGIFNDGRNLFVGPKNPNDGNIETDYIIVDLPNGHIEEMMSASGYNVNIDIFKALCPKRVQ